LLIDCRVNRTERSLTDILNFSVAVHVIEAGAKTVLSALVELSPFSAAPIPARSATKLHSVSTVRSQVVYTCSLRTPGYSSCLHFATL
jgi:hypothetical protein